MVAGDSVQEFFELQQLFDGFEKCAAAGAHHSRYVGSQTSELELVANRLQNELFFLRKKVKTWYGPLFRLHQVRVKNSGSYMRKVFGLAVKTLPTPTLVLLDDAALLDNCSGGIYDKVGARLCVAYHDDIPKAVDLVKGHFGSAPDMEVLDAMDEDYLTTPRSGYRAYHLHVRLSGVCSEIQVKSVLSHAWAELCHDLVFKPLLRTPQGIPTLVRKDTVVFSSLLGSSDELFSNMRERVRLAHAGDPGGR